MTIEAGDLEGLPEDLASRVAAALALDRGPLRITSQDVRSLSQNRALVAERLQAMVEAAMAPPPPPRRRTRPSKRARAERVSVKRARGETKRLRRPPDKAD